MKEDRFDKYMSDGKGNLSSKRLMSWKMMWFFFIFNTIAWTTLMWLTLGNRSTSNLDINWIFALLALDLILLIATFAPTQLSKVTEMKEIIELGKSKAEVKEVELETK